MTELFVTIIWLAVAFMFIVGGFLFVLSLPFLVDIIGEFYRRMRR